MGSCISIVALRHRWFARVNPTDNMFWSFGAIWTLFSIKQRREQFKAEYPNPSFNSWRLQKAKTKKREREREREIMEAIDSVFDPLREFAKDSIRLVKRCHKPDRKGENSIWNLCFFLFFLDYSVIFIGICKGVNFCGSIWVQNFQRLLYVLQLVS